MTPDWKLRELQPSQFYISEKKLRDVGSTREIFPPSRQSRSECWTASPL